MRQTITIIAIILLSVAHSTFARAAEPTDATRVGCVSAKSMTEILTGGNSGMLIGMGQILVDTMIETDDSTLNATGNMISKAMLSYSNGQMPESASRIDEALKTYVARCKTLGAWLMVSADAPHREDEGRE